MGTDTFCLSSTILLRIMHWYLCVAHDHVLCRLLILQIFNEKRLVSRILHEVACYVLIYEPSLLYCSYKRLSYFSLVKRAPLLIKLTWNLFGLTTVLFRVTGALSCKPGYYYPLAVLQWRICVRDIKASLFPVVPLYREYILTCYPGACKMYHGARPGLARGPRETNLVPPGETLPYMGYVGMCGPKG